MAALPLSVQVNFVESQAEAQDVLAPVASRAQTGRGETGSSFGVETQQAACQIPLQIVDAQLYDASGPIFVGACLIGGATFL